MIQPFDFHTHTHYADGLSSPTEMIESALAKGLRVYGISEHSPRLPNFRYLDDPVGQVRGLARWPEYLTELDRLKKEYADRIELLKGCEVDWLGSDQGGHYEKLLSTGQFDYTIGSVHFLGGWGFDYIGDWEAGYHNFDSLVEIYRTYYAEYASMVRSGLFDIGGHLDLIKKFNDQYPLPSGVDPVELARPALDALAESDMVLEISSAGLVKPCRDWYPAGDLLRAVREREIPVTINSDAHSTDRIAEGFEQAVAFARTAGFDSVVCLHRGGEREVVAI